MLMLSLGVNLFWFWMKASLTQLTCSLEVSLQVKLIQNHWCLWRRFLPSGTTIAHFDLWIKCNGSRSLETDCCTWCVPVHLQHYFIFVIIVELQLSDIQLFNILSYPTCLQHAQNFFKHRTFKILPCIYDFYIYKSLVLHFVLILLLPAIYYFHAIV
jgi:hypothetical protein